MNQKWLKKGFRIISLMFLPPLIIIFWLIGTASGLNFVYQTAKSYIPGSLTIGELEGSLVGSISANNLQYKYNGTVLNVAKLSMKWLPARLFSKNLVVSRLHLQSVKISLPVTAKNKSVQLSTLPKLDLPWRTVFKNVVINNFTLNQADKIIELNQIKLGISSLLNQVKIQSHLQITNHSEFNLKGQINLHKKFKHKFETNYHVKLSNNADLESKGNIEGDISSIKIHQFVNGPVQLAFKAEVRNLLHQLNWQAQADVININPEKIWPEWQAQVKGQITSNGSTKNGKLFAYIDFSKLKGQVRGYPVSLLGRLQWQDNTLELKYFNFTSGTTKFNAQGKIHSKLNLKWSLTSSNLAELYPAAQGQLNIRSQLKGTTSSPILNTSFNAEDITLTNYKISSIKGNIGLDLFSWKNINVKLASQWLKFKEYELQSLQISADSNHSEIKLLSNSATAFIKIKNEIQPQALHLRIVKTDLVSPHFSAWKLKSPVSLRISNDQFLLDPLCVLSTEGKFCTTLHKNNHTWQSHIEVSKLPLMIFNPWLPPDIKLEGATDATADLILSSQLRGQSHINLLPGTVSYSLLSGERKQLKYHNGTIDVTLNEQGLKTSYELNMSNTDTVKGYLLLPNVKLPALDMNKQILQATAQLNINNLSLLEVFIPEAEDLEGEARLNFAVSGTLSQPKLKGYAQLNNGAVRIPRLGLSIKQLNIKGQSDNFDRLDFQLSARSGEGIIKVYGRTQLDRNTGWPTSLTVNGDNFEVAHIPSSQLVISPKLQLNLFKHTIKISGNVDIPYAKLHPKDITTAERISDDVIIIGGDKPADEKWLIYTNVRLLFGDRIHFTGFGFDGRLAGSLLLEDEPYQVTKAVGEIKIPEGRYTAYGQNLRVENGKILFTGGPVTNPGLDLRATRQIDAVTAGIKVRGSLKQPQIQLFSIPVMGQTDILSYLLLGSPIEKASGKEGEMMAKAALTLSLIGGDRIARTIGEQFGLDEMRVESSSGDQASLVIGRYLSPKLYIGYGIGLIESFNTLNVRYKISDKWQLKGESGENQGADILYTIER